MAIPPSGASIAFTALALAALIAYILWRWASPYELIALLQNDGPGNVLISILPRSIRCCYFGCCCAGGKGHCCSCCKCRGQGAAYQTKDGKGGENNDDGKMSVSPGGGADDWAAGHQEDRRMTALGWVLLTLKVRRVGDMQIHTWKYIGSR